MRARFMIMPVRYLVLGHRGALGQSLMRELQKSGEVYGVGRETFSLEDPTSVSRAVRTFNPQVIVNCVALMPADRCESEEALSYQVNYKFPQLLWEAVRDFGILCFSFSSDFVFDGESNTPYEENAPVSPLSIYGKHKALLERFAYDIDIETFRVLRFSSLITNTSQRKTFLEKVIDSARMGNRLKLVSDLTMSITTSSLLAKVISESPNLKLNPVSNVVHEGVLSWSELALYALDSLNIQYDYELVPSSAFSTLAKRPIYSALKMSYACEILGSKHWRDAVLEVIQSDF